MRMWSRRRNLVVWNPSLGAADRYGALSFPRITLARRFRWWLRTGALLSVIGIRRLARIVRSRSRPVFLVSGALLMVVGLELSSSAAFVPGLLVLLVGLLKGNGASHGRSAAQMTAAHWHG
jgi:hypothetical protein